MSSWEKSLREPQPRRHPKNPSFSSILLDEMFRSIDGDDKKSEEIKVYKEQSTRKNSNNNGGIVRVKVSSIEDEEMASIKRACLMEKLMEKKINNKVSSRRTSSLPEMESRSLHDNDPMFFSTSSSSSDFSSGCLSSSDAEFYASAKSRTSCFSAARPKPNKATVPSRPGRYQNPSYYEQSEYYLFDDYHSTQQTSKTEENLIKSKSRALKIYSNLKKVKQPISPGGRLTNFINSIFTNGNAKKTKNVNINGGYEDVSIEKEAKSTNASTCSSASSFSRSCLSKTAPDSRAKYDINGVKRTVRFYPVSVIVDEDSRPCGHKSLYDDDFDKYGRPHSAQSVAEVNVIEKNRKSKEGARDVYKRYQNQKKYYFMKERVVQRNVCHYEDEDEDEDDDDDAASDSSSDLFEIDHLALFGNKRFCEELPVYETTHLDRNRAIASGLDIYLYVATCSPARDDGAGYVVAWGHSTLVGPDKPSN